ncbi:MAG: OFA family MFS transporter [Verrucomicrobiota bacterium]|nr:OFA family MFS transporter [Limisphaera sp.]MDW8381302.1 OFA family MFS transporter [Verrucomicrobiota bacterium]
MEKPVTYIPGSSARGWLVASAGTGINLALGVLYTWSLFKGAIEQQFGWNGDQLNDPYALCCLVFAFTMILAGRCQDLWGPRLTATLGGLLVGIGLVLISTTRSYLLWLVGFGILVGAGIGFGYASATPPALKWFPAQRTGLIAGLVVSGFGLAPVYLAPLSQWLLNRFGVQQSMLMLGLGFVGMVCCLAQLLVNPPASSASLASASVSREAARVNVADGNTPPREMLRQVRFWWLWLIYCIGAGAGLMVIGSISGMAKKSMGDWAFLAVAVLAVGNAGGRILAGGVSDRIGRRQTLTLVLGLQALLMFVAIPVTGWPGVPGVWVVVVAALMGANYGANLALFPSFCKDLWGLRHFGTNYGLLFTAWGVGGLLLPRLQQTLTSYSGGSYTSAFVTAGALLIGAALLTLRWPSTANPEPR